MNEILEAMKTRRSCRNFKPDMPPQELIDQICEAGTYAPTGMNRQSPQILVVKEQKLRDRLAYVNAQLMNKPEDFDPFYGAPVVLIVLADKAAPTYQYDGSLVMANLLLAAHAVGLGSCWIHRAKEEFQMEEFKEILRSLGIDGEFEGIGHCVIGYENAPHPDAPPRKIGYVRTVGE